MRSIGLHYRRNEQLHDERSITYEPHEAVQATPATSARTYRPTVFLQLGQLPRWDQAGIS